MKPDPIELELFRHIFISVAEEMGIVLRKTAFSPNIKERRDYSCAIYDERGATVAMGEHMPVHLGAMPLSVESAMRQYEFHPGDVVILNDPFQGGTHLPDITAVSAVFAGGKKPAFYIANRAHHADVGGMSPGSMPLAREIYQEGLRIPPVRLVREGIIDDDLFRLLLANVRTPVERDGDIRAQLNSLERGRTRLLEIQARYGAPAVRGNMRRLQDYSEAMMRSRLLRIPDGVYSFEDFLDGDGSLGRPIRITAAIRIAGDRAHVDFTGSDPQCDGPVNANYAIVLAATAYVFRCLLREDVPFTSGLLRPIGIVAPEGTVVNARLPAAMAAGNVETSQRITDVLLGALAKAIPGEMPAASSGTMNNLTFGGWDPIRERAFTYYETIAGGMGASAQYPGWSAVHTHMTNSWNTPVEALEHAFPIRVRAYSIRRNSGGKGANRGGDGICRELQFLAPSQVTLLTDRRDSQPWGLEGGHSGAPGRNTIIRSGKAIRLPAKVEAPVESGDLLRIETPGGGGYGKTNPERQRMKSKAPRI